MQTPWAVILCKFSDGNVEPFPKQYYKDLFAVTGVGSSWNMVRYFDEWSHGALDLSGSKVFGWYQLDKSVADYNALGQGARNALIKWARDAATANGVNLSGYYSTVAVTNLWQDIGMASDGIVAQGPLTPNPMLLGQEMGHVYGLMHSRIDGSDDDYMDQWDVMSGANVYNTVDSEFGKMGPGLNAWNMRYRAWLHEARVWKESSDNVDETLTLRPLVRRDLRGYLAAEVWSGYLAEFRVKEGWDGGIPRSAVFIHRFEGGHSYLMRGNSGKPDLVAGDSFGDAAPDGSPIDLFSNYARVEVLSIDEDAKEAVLGVRRHKPPYIWPAIDPMALLLSGSAYAAVTEWKHPHEPKISDIRTAMASMSTHERRLALQRAKAMITYGKAVAAAAQKAEPSLGVSTKSRKNSKR